MKQFQMDKLNCEKYSAISESHECAFHLCVVVVVEFTTIAMLFQLVVYNLSEEQLSIKLISYVYLPISIRHVYAGIPVHAAKTVFQLFLL